MAADESDFSKVKTYPFAERRNLVRVEDFRRPPEDPAAIAPLLTSLPDVLGARALLALARAIVGAHGSGRGVVFALGGHVAKTGAGLHLIPLLREGFVTHLAVNGAFLIHDYELGRFGATSEDVAANLPAGRFGLAEETGAELNALVAAAANEGEPAAVLAGRAVAERGGYADASVLAEAAAAGVPVTLHVALGADVVHQHPAADGAAWGEAGLADFRRLAAALKSLDGGGVFVNVGSAVLLPEVFVKALNLIRNVEPPVENFTTANLDMIQHYRPRQNVLARPTAGSGEALALTGHHEIMVPLLSAAVRAFAREQE
ncbi:MAG TPA: hypothetical protein VMX79_09805 [bacterium]|nr:hypothetical protein [bacterium]